MKTNLILILMVGVFLFAPGCGDKVLAPDTDIIAEVEREMEAQGIPSVVACVVRGEEVVWETALGFANVRDSIPADRYTLYTLMSITKLFLATAVMQLWEEGRLDLDEDISTYLPFEVRNPNFPDREITSHMLLTHTSSLAWPVEEDRIYDFHHFYYTDEKVPLLREWLPEYILPEGEYYRNSVWKDFPPGEQELYSNFGTSLLGLVVEEVSGMDFRDYCREYILIPLEMHQSAFRFANLDEALQAYPYAENYNAGYPYTCRHYPAGFLKSNLEDFSHFLIAFLNYGEYKGTRILEVSTVERMFELQNPTSGTSYLWSNCLGDCIGHSGGGTGFSNRAEWYLDKNKAMVILSNTYNTSVYPKGRIYELMKFQVRKY